MREAMKVVADTSPLIALERIGRLDILPGLFGSVVCPQSVIDELRAFPGHLRADSSIEQSSWLSIRPDPREMVFRKELGAGETAAIALAVNIKAEMIVLDDLAARRIAREIGLKISGTLGIVLAACRYGLLADVAGTLDDLRSAGFHLSNTLIRDCIARAERYSINGADDPTA